MTKLALIGKGKWGKKYLAEVKKLPNVEITTVKTHDWKDLIGSTDIDGIIIATPDNTHAEIIKAFPDTYLLVEKPFVTSLQDAITIKNKKIMVGYIYLYNLTLQELLKDIGQISHITFQIQNTDKAENTTPLWYLLSHAVSFCLLHLGRPTTIKVNKHSKDSLNVTLLYPYTTCELEASWSAVTKKRFIEVKGDKRITYNGTETHKVTPLQNELQAFVNFIHGTAVPSNLNHAIEVTNTLSQIEKMLA